MRGKYRPHHILQVVLLFIALAGFSASNSKANENSKYLDAVREFADNVLKYGRDTYGPKHTPLFVDGLNIHTHEPVKWIAPNGDRWVLSNFASQQTLMRTLDGLSTLTGDPKYCEAAMQAVEYAFEHVRTASGLLYWGHLAAYDAQADKPYGDQHVLKLDYPHYDLMWKVNPNETKRFIEAYWSAHVNDWSNLDFNRIARIGRGLEEPWNHEYKDGPTFFKSKYGGGGFFVTATSLIQAGTTLYRLSRQEQPLVWSKRLAKRFVDSRHAKTGIAHGLYNNPLPPLGDDLKEHFQDPHTMVFPYLPFEETRYAYWPENKQVKGWLSLILVGDTLGKHGKEFKQWAIEELTACGKASYRKKDNSFVPILTDGTSIEGYVSKEYTRYGPKGAVAKPLFADLPFFWGYAVAYRATSDEFMWEMVRNIAFGNDFGDIGETSVNVPKLRIDTTCCDVYGLLGFLELYTKTNKLEFLRVAQRIGDNIVDNQFYKGFFVPSNRHIYTRFDCFEPLALLHLHVATTSKAVSVPQAWPSSPLFIPSYRYKEEGVDRRIIYTLTESSEPPLSLQEAAAIGDIELVRSLLNKEVGVDSLDDSYFKTALQRAAMSGHKEVAEFLITKGARIDHQDSFPGGTALDYAAENGHKEIVELLIAKGADVNAKRTGYPVGDTPLHSAVRSGHKDIVELLITKGADINAKNNQGQTPLDVAVANNRKDIIELLAEKGATISTIHLVAYMGDLAKLEAFIQEGVDINALDSHGYAPLHYAVQNGQKEVAELLIARDADVNATNNGGNTPLHFAVRAGHKDIVELLITKGADINAKDTLGRTPIDLAVNQGRKEIAKLLLSKGCDVSLYTAAYIGDLQRVEKFIDDGADVDAKDQKDQTALHYAAKAGQIAVAKLLIANGADVNVNAGEWTPLQEAAYYSKEMVELLLAKGANINTGKWTALHSALDAERFDIVELLLAKGADANIRDDKGRTPLHIAAWYAAVSKPTIVELLLSKGADINLKDNNDKTALSYAIENGYTEIVELLRKHGAKE